MPIKNYTTSVPVDRTIADITKILVRRNATSILTDYDAGEPVALRFQVDYLGKHLHFRLPVNIKGVDAALRAERLRYEDAKVKRIAWRIVKDWVDAQMALIEAGQAELPQVFLPYAVGDNGETFFEKIKRQSFLQLTHKKDDDAKRP